jgi:predicted dehydrogenase
MALKTGVIGCGYVSQFHFAGLADLQAEVRWACDLDETRARGRAEPFGAKVTGDYREVLADPQVQVVHITTPSPLHKEVCLAAIRAGKAVICEKTLATNAADAWEIVSAAEKAGTIFYTSYMKRFIPAVQKAKELMAGLGMIIGSWIRSYQMWGDIWEEMPREGGFSTTPGGMSGVRKLTGGGVLVACGSHILDLVNFFLGRPVRVFGDLAMLPGRDYDLRGSALLQTPNGPAHFEAMGCPLRRIGFERDGWDERFEINGSRGRLEMFFTWWDRPLAKAPLLVHYDNRTSQSTEYRFDPVSPFSRAIAFFHENIAAGRQGPQSRLTGYEVDEVIECITRSHETRQAVEVPWKT